MSLISLFRDLIQLHPHALFVFINEVRWCSSQLGVTLPVSFGSQQEPLFSLWHLFQVKSRERAKILPPRSRHLPRTSLSFRWLDAARMNEIQEATSPATSLSGPAACVSKVELRVSCKALLDRDTLNKSDPCVILMVQTNGQWTEVSPSLKTCFFFFSPIFISALLNQLSTFISLTFAYTRSDHSNPNSTAISEILEKKSTSLPYQPASTLSWFGEFTAVFFFFFSPLKWSQLTQQLSDSEQKMSDVEYIYRGESQHSPQLLINWQQIVLCTGASRWWTHVDKQWAANVTCRYLARGWTCLSFLLGSWADVVRGHKVFHFPVN